MNLYEVNNGLFKLSVINLDNEHLQTKVLALTDFYSCFAEYGFTHTQPATS